MADDAFSADVVHERETQPSSHRSFAEAAITIIPAEQRVRHLAVIPDGNRRWARLRGLSVREGHKRGFLTVAPRLIEYSWSANVDATTLWMFSTDNWRRADCEVRDLMEIYGDFIKTVIPLCQRYNAKILHMGRRDRIPKNLLATLENAIDETRENNKHELILGLDYGGKDQLLQNVRVLLDEPADALRCTDAALMARLEAPIGDMAQVDLVLRTSHEQRLSGFMPYQSAYAELCFIEKYFPDFTENDLKAALCDYALRKRRYGQ